MKKGSKRAVRGLLSTIGLLVLVGVLPWTASADEKPTFEIEVIVARLTTESDKIDRGAKRLHKELKEMFRYEGIRVLETRELELSVDDVFDMKLPTRRRLRLRPLVIEKKSALVSVEISGLVQTDLKLREGQLIIIGAERYLDGKLVIALHASD